MLIYILEDEDNIREIESYALTNSGFEVSEFSSPSDFYKALCKNIPNLIILDIMLPEQNGLSVLKYLKEDSMYAKIPVIIVSARTTELDRVKGIDMGADDYICKPFGVMELVSRVRARLRNTVREREYSYKGIVLSEKKRTVSVDGEKIELTYKEFELLKMLISSPENVRTRESILDTVWNYGESSGRTLDMHIKTLRKKLGDKGKYITTIRNVGYKLEEN